MNKIFQQIGYSVVYSFWYAMSLLPFPVLYALSDLLYIILALIIRYRRRTILHNLRTSFPEKSEVELRIIMLKFYHRFCDYIVELIKLMSMSRRQVVARMQFDGIDEVNKVLSSGQSVAFYLSHTFNWEYISTVPHWVSSEVVCGEIYHPLENKIFDRLVLRVRQANRAVGVPMNDTLRQIASWRKEGILHIMGYLYDQKPHWKNIHHWVPFLNHDTPVLTGAERISKATDEAVFYGDMERIRRGYYVCHLRLITDKPKELPDWEITNRYYEALEKTIRRQPELWLWSHKRWSRTREEFDRRFMIVNGKVVDKPQNTNN